MGCEDYHLHQFVIGSRIYGVPDPDDELYGRKVLDEKSIRLADAVTRVGTHFEYLYDFGDSWYHDLRVEAILLPEPTPTYPRCLAGQRCAPPEHVGGIGGYQNYLEASLDPHHREHESMLEWRGLFSESFSLSDVNHTLQNKFRSARNAASTARVSESPFRLQ
jgi:hypothetical protein